MVRRGHSLRIPHRRDAEFSEQQQKFQLLGGGHRAGHLDSLTLLWDLSPQSNLPKERAGRKMFIVILLILTFENS